MSLQLSAEQARVLGCLMEKAVTTPDQYPLTLNALVNACNQKSSRDPVMALEQGQVQRATTQLEERQLVVKDENFRSRVQKFSQRLCGTPFAEYEFDAAQYAVICLLLLRGAHTPGEIRSRSGRLHSFADNEEARTVLNSLIEREGGALVAQLPKRAGRQDHEYVQLLTADAASVAVAPAPAPAPTPTPPTQSVADVGLKEAQDATGGRAGNWQAAADLRIGELERRVVSLEAALDALRQGSEG